MSATRVDRCSHCRAPFTRASVGRPREFCSTRCRVAAHRKRGKRSVHFRSQTDNWATPQETFDELHAEFGFTLDVCASAENAKCDRFFTREDNGLTQDWTGHVCWMNPPYGRTIGQWMRKAHEANATVVCLVPARVDTAWWHSFAPHGEVRFLKGRLKFGGHANSAPFPSAVVVFRNKPEVTKSFDASLVELDTTA